MQNQMNWNVCIHCEQIIWKKQKMLINAQFLSMIIPNRNFVRFVTKAILIELGHLKIYNFLWTYCHILTLANFPDIHYRSHQWFYRKMTHSCTCHMKIRRHHHSIHPDILNCTWNKATQINLIKPAHITSCQQISM